MCRNDTTDYHVIAAQRQKSNRGGEKNRDQGRRVKITVPSDGQGFLDRKKHLSEKKGHLKLLRKKAGQKAVSPG